MSDAKTHTLIDGESAESIAVKYGLPMDAIWELPENKDLRERRKDPHILKPGDKLAIPERKPLKYQRGIDQDHEVSVHVPKSELKLQLKKLGKPRANQPCILVVDGVETRPSTDGDGNLVVPISPNASNAKLTIGVGKDQVIYRLLLRGIHPSSVVSGWQARLHNLGYPVDVDGNATGSMGRAALSLFQETNKLAANGEANDATRAKLEEKYGC